MLDKLKIGLLDLLTILLPGGFLVFILSDRIIYFVSSNWQGYPILDNSWVTLGASFALAYILGHFIFFIGSFLDDLIYEKIRKVFWHDHAKLTAYVLMIKEKRTGIRQRKVLSAWKWACAYLMSSQAAIYGEVERHMAESKFFRSLVVVLISSIFLFPGDKRSSTIIIGICILIVLSLIRYLTQRQKSLETAYHGVITAANEVLPAEPDPAIFSGIKKGLLVASLALQKRILENDDNPDKRIRLDKFFNFFAKLFYSIGLCIVPGFSLLMRAGSIRRQKREAKGNLVKQNTMKQVNKSRNKMMAGEKLIQ